jgi:hypothetical protein
MIVVGVAGSQSAHAGHGRRRRDGRPGSGLVGDLEPQMIRVLERALS